MTTAIHNHASHSDVWHVIDADEVLPRLDSNTQTGLDAGEVSRRLEKFGRNRLPEGSKRRPLIRFLLQLNNILIYVLLAAGFVKLMVGFGWTPPSF
jgi:magnesium-transporting ATPase (P-type)